MRKHFTFLCPGNKDFVKYKAQGEVNPNPPCVRPCLSIYIYKMVFNREKINERTEVFVLLKQKKLDQKKRIVN